MIDKPHIFLTEDEVVACTMVGIRRHTQSVTKNSTPAYGCKAKDSLMVHIEGACGEMAVAKLAGKYWGFHTLTFENADIGGLVQVRTRSNHNWDLLVRDKDKDDHAFLLVTGTPPEFIIHGWLWGREAKQPKYLAEHGHRDPAYFVPQSDLRPMFRDKEPDD